MRTHPGAASEMAWDAFSANHRYPATKVGDVRNERDFRQASDLRWSSRQKIVYDVETASLLPLAE
jgi:hypothetical protein